MWRPRFHTRRSVQGGCCSQSTLIHCDLQASSQGSLFTLPPGEQKLRRLFRYPSSLCKGTAGTRLVLEWPYFSQQQPRLAHSAVCSLVYWLNWMVFKADLGMCHSHIRTFSLFLFLALSHITAYSNRRSLQLVLDFHH